MELKEPEVRMIGECLDKIKDILGLCIDPNVREIHGFLVHKFGLPIGFVWDAGIDGWIARELKPGWSKRTKEEAIKQLELL